MGLKSTFLSPPTELAPPPAYTASSSGSLDRTSRFPPTVWSLILSHFLQVYPEEEGGSTTSLYHLHRTLRLVSKALYSLCTYLLRTHFLPQYERKVVPPYTSSPLSQREARVLDHFIAFRITLDMWRFESSLLVLDDKGVEDDLFRWLQPQTRVEDLLQAQADGSVWTASGVDWSDITVGYKVRNVALLLPFQSGAQAGERLRTGSDDGGRDDHDLGLADEDSYSASSLTRAAPSAVRIIRRPLLEVERARDESLETTTYRLTQALRRYRLVRKVEHDGRVWYELVGQAA